MAERGPLVGLRSFFFGGGVFLAAARQRNEENFCSGLGSCSHCVLTKNGKKGIKAGRGSKITENIQKRGVDWDYCRKTAGESDTPQSRLCWGPVGARFPSGKADLLDSLS